MGVKLDLTSREEHRLKVFDNKILRVDIREMKWLETGRNKRMHNVFNLLYNFPFHQILGLSNEGV
jgi:hypothetical protein